MRWLFLPARSARSTLGPELDLPEEIVAGADTASIDSISWQSLYVDTTLQRLITIALDNNKDMKIAVAKVKEMIASKRITFADQFPEIGARIYGQKERLNYGGDNPKPDPEYGAKLALSWELDLWGNLRWANEAGNCCLSAIGGSTSRLADDIGSGSGCCLL